MRARGWAVRPGRVGIGTLVVLVFVGLGGCARPQPSGVVRVFDGQPTLQRPIYEEAYGRYFAGALFESRGQLKEALEAYGQALAWDPASPEIVSRLVAVRCKLKDPTAGPAFAALALEAPNFEPFWRSKAECHLLRGELDQAERAAHRAIALDPLQPEATRILVSVLRKKGRAEEAERWLAALELREPQHPHSRTVDDPEAAAEAMDQSILANQLGQAREAALRAQRGPTALALRALELGRWELAERQARLVLGAQPDNSDAWIVALAAADLRRDFGEVERISARLGGAPFPPSPAASRIFAEVMARLVGEEARQVWNQALARQPQP